ncbi:conserved repeat domain protein [Sulfuricurvum kujiense DSM 16994]|uniref:Conserved repeat domain protein n=1 Tax=Sulfuricurvum kujiense (strain ATCC BAA-921 / DSM 16994 / JCM 11577 / YK-1) TaxID=709032 RepID=E4TYK9_SULKY|nr:conserved repeat domain protein [Sulfuricurvum kujiense DSM 16994]
MKINKLFLRWMTTFGMVMVCTTFGHSAEVAFNTPYYSTNVNGDMTTLGNTIVWKDTVAANAYGVDVSTSIPTDRNNAYNMKFIDVLSDGVTTFNSSSSSLDLPAGCTVKWAGLYWQGHIVNKNLEGGADNSKIGTGVNNTAVYDDAKSKANTVYFRRPDGTSYNLTAQVFYDYPTDISGGKDRRYLYSGFYNVTNYVKAVGSGSYTVGNIRTSEGTIATWGGLGGWAMLVIYEDITGTLQLKNVSVFHGYRVLNSGDVQDINVNGFLTPSGGTINASLAIFVADGDKLGSNSTGEHLKIWNTSSVLTDIVNGTNPLNNVFNSTITNLGVDNVTRTPNFTDNLGIDIDRFDVSSYMNHSQNNTRIQVSTVGDLYTIDLIAFATDIYQPFISIAKSTDSSGTVTSNQTITYTANIKNTGNEGASNIVIYDNFDDNNLTKIDGNITNPLVTLGDLLDHNTTTILDSVVCNYGPSHTDCKSLCTVGLSPFKIACSIPSMAVGETAFMQFQTKIASNPDTHGQSVKVENKMYATYYNALTGAAVDQTSSNLADAGQYLYAQNIPASGFDARETSIAEADNDRSIKTKIVNKTFQLNIVSLDTAGAIAPYTVPTGNRVYLFPVDSSLCLLSDSEKLTQIESLPRNTYVDFANGDTTKPSPAIDLSNALLSAVAGRDKRIALNYVDWGTSFQAASFSCSNSNTQAVLLGVPQCLNADHKIGDVFGQLTQDVCAGGAAHGMNPALANPPCQSNSYTAGNLPSAPFDNAYGCYQCIAGMAGKVSCSTDNFAIRPDHFSFTAPVAKMKAGEDYSLNVIAYDNNGNSAQEYDQSVANLAGAPATWWQRDANVVLNPVNTQGTITISGAGTFSNGAGAVPIRYSDVGKFTLELKDSNWAAVDLTDTGITENEYTIQGDRNVTFIPYDFNISVGRIVNNDGATPSFTYLSSDLNMSARIPMTIRAQNKQGALTQNYANNLYERTITITPHVASVVATARGLVPKTVGATNADANFVSGSTSIVFNDPLAAKFNFSRDPRVVVSPFDVNSSNGVGNDVNVSIVDADNVYGDKNRTLIGNATFVYGRFIPRDIRVFGNVPFSANGWYEVFNAPKINGIILTPSKNESMWYINHLHNDVTFGDANITSVLAATHTALPVSSISNGTGMESYQFNAETPPYSSKAHIKTKPWLWYGPSASAYADPGTDCSTHPCFNIAVVPSVGATGSSKDQNVGSKTNKSTSDGAGVWKSTRDYAPAIR